MGIGAIDCLRSLTLTHLTSSLKNSSLKELVFSYNNAVRICKTSEDEKIKLLYKFFSKSTSS